MVELWSVVEVVLAAGVVGVTSVARGRRRRRERERALEAGAVVYVHTLDRKRLIARVLARGPSHFWIELAPGDARWWVPASAVEPARGLVIERRAPSGRASFVVLRGGAELSWAAAAFAEGREPVLSASRARARRRPQP